MHEQETNDGLARSSRGNTLVPLSEQIMQIMIERITDYSYPPGSRIDIEALKKKYRISHIPIRDALNKLSEQGLVTAIPRVGYFTVKFTRAELDDLFDVRILLELSAISKGLKTIDKKKLHMLEEKLSCLKKNLANATNASKKENAFYEFNEILHRDIIIKNANSQLMEKIYASLLYKIKLAARIVYLPDDDIEEHQQLIAALLAGDGATSKRLLRKHLISVRNRCVLKLQETETSG